MSIADTLWAKQSAGIPVKTFLWGPHQKHPEFRRIENCAAHLEQEWAVPYFDPQGDPDYEQLGICAFIERSAQRRSTKEAEAIVAYVAAQGSGGPRPERDAAGVLKNLRSKLTLVVPETDRTEYKRLALETAVGSRWLAYYPPQRPCPCPKDPRGVQQNPASKQCTGKPWCDLTKWAKLTVEDVRKRKFLALLVHFTIDERFSGA